MMLFFKFWRGLGSRSRHKRTKKFSKKKNLVKIA